jgi:deoxyribose-phosphate aldolase
MTDTDTSTPRTDGAVVRPFDGPATDAALRRFLDGLPGVDAVGLEQRAAVIASRSVKTSSKAAALDTIVSLIDLTTLEGSDTPGRVRSLVSKAIAPDPSDPSVGRVAAVCVYNDMVGHAVRALGRHHVGAGGDIAVAAVSTAFPSGQAPGHG